MNEYGITLPSERFLIPKVYLALKLPIAGREERRPAVISADAHVSSFLAPKVLSNSSRQNLMGLEKFPDFRQEDC